MQSLSVSVSTLYLQIEFIIQHLSRSEPAFHIPFERKSPALLQKALLQYSVSGAGDRERPFHSPTVGRKVGQNRSKTGIGAHIAIRSLALDV